MSRELVGIDCVGLIRSLKLLEQHGKVVMLKRTSTYDGVKFSASGLSSRLVLCVVGVLIWRFMLFGLYENLKRYFDFEVCFWCTTVKLFENIYVSKLKVKDNYVDYLGWFSLMSIFEESSVVNSSSTKIWVMDPSMFDV
jgi:hypothetical protein